MSLVVDLRSLSEDAALQAGGKIAGLARLSRAGMPVPPGFCVTGEAFSAQARDPAPGREGLLRALVREPLDPGIESAVRRACANLQWPVAVRSSAPDEDSAGASFAGQHDTYLGVGDAEQVLRALRDCWGSFFSERAAEYREAMGAREASTIRPWVLVQEQVRADAAGVAFTIDPVDGSSRIVVNAVRGLGEALVSGRVEPDRFVLDRSTGAVVEAAAVCGEPCLDPPALAALHAVLMKAEEIFGFPLDVEFALAGGDPWLLQARPITSSGAEWTSELDSTIPEGFTRFTRANASEVMPEVVTPLVHSIMFGLGERGFSRSAVEYGAWTFVTDARLPYFQGCFYGRVVLNLSTLLDCASRIPGQDPQSLGENYFGQTRDPDDRTRPDHRLKRLARIPRIVRLLATLGSRGKKAVAAVDAFEAAERPAPDLARDELRAAAERTMRLAEDVLVVHLHASSLAGASYEALGKAVTRWTGGTDPGLTARLVTGLHTLDSAGPTHALWDWSREVLTDPGQAELVRGSVGPVQLLGEPVTDAAKRFRRGLDAFLARYGSRGRDAGSAWQEDPTPVTEMLRGFLDLPEEQSPKRVAARQSEIRTATTAQLRRSLSIPRRAKLRMLVSSAHRYITLRENLKGATVRVTARCRGIGLEAGRRLAVAGVLPSASDAAFLRLDELLSLAESSQGSIDVADVRRRIARRRREYERNLSVDIPESFEGRPQPVRRALQTEPGDELHGIAVSPGRVTGKARVVLEPGRGAFIELGEILVAPITDTGWTPLFAFAAGLVVDLGGQLSHGSIVAREFGLPAVVNVKQATRTIRTGDRLTVDGDLGIVYLHRDERRDE